MIKPIPSLEEIEAAAMGDGLLLRDMMRGEIGQLWARFERDLREYAALAKTKGKIVAVSPAISGDTDPTRDPARPYVISVKADTLLLNPGERPPAGWTTIEALP